MPMVILCREWEYGGEMRPPGTKLTVSKQLQDWLVKQQIADQFVAGGVAASAATVAGASAVPRSAVIKQKIRSCGGCGW